MHNYQYATTKDVYFVFDNMSLEDKKQAKRMKMSRQLFANTHMPCYKLEYDGDICIFNWQTTNTHYLIWQLATWRSNHAKRFFRREMLNLLAGFDKPVLAIQHHEHYGGCRWLTSLGFKRIGQYQQGEYEFWSYNK